jgi:methylated-DNA-[protein]-cysteine S-methyltransferase
MPSTRKQPLDKIYFPSRAHLVDTDLGWIVCAWRGGNLVRITIGRPDPQSALLATDCEIDVVGEGNATTKRFAKRLLAHASGKRQDYSDVMIDLDWATDFQRAVFTACRRIPWGEVLTYAELAAQVGSPNAARAVGSAMSRNRCPLVIPCHRVIAANRKLGGFTAPSGAKLKERLLRLEGSWPITPHRPR